MPKLKLHLFGKASGRAIKSWEFDENSPALDLDVLQFLRQERIPIASSCFGEGVCKKCVINTNQLACQTLLKDFFNQNTEANIAISYL